MQPQAKVQKVVGGLTPMILTVRGMGKGLQQKLPAKVQIHRSRQVPYMQKDFTTMISLSKRRTWKSDGS
jgi:hypothetical protein